MDIVSFGLFLSNTSGAFDFNAVNNGFCMEHITANSPLLDLLTATLFVVASNSATSMGVT